MTTSATFICRTCEWRQKNLDIMRSERVHGSALLTCLAWIKGCMGHRGAILPVFRRAVTERLLVAPLLMRVSSAKTVEY